VRPFIHGLAFALALALAGGACGSQEWSFDVLDGAAAADGGAETGACSDDNDCPADASVCQRGVCIRCATDPDCAAATGGRVCRIATGRCVDCVMDIDCPASRPRCDTSTDTCVRCLANSDCGFESFCVKRACTVMF
jgi:hypothetical protein